MNDPKKNSPIAVLRDGAIKATIWLNESENGTFPSIEITRSYTDNDGVWKDTHRFGKNELLRLARLAQLAYDSLIVANGNSVNEEGGGV